MIRTGKDHTAPLRLGAKQREQPVEELLPSLGRTLSKSPWSGFELDVQVQIPLVSGFLQLMFHLVHQTEERLQGEELPCR